MKNAFVLLIAVIIFISSPAWGVSARSLPIAVLLEHPVRGERVVLEGHFVSEVNYETFLFRDDSGEIEVLVDEGDLLPEYLISPEYRVRLKAETDSGYMATTILRFESVAVISHTPTPKVVVDESVNLDPQHATDRKKRIVNREQQDATTAQKSFTCKESPSIHAEFLVNEIATLHDHPCFGRTVVLKGTFVEQVNYETLLFRDQTGEIEVIIAEDDMPIISTTSWSRPVMLHGELKKGYQRSVTVLFDSFGN